MQAGLDGITIIIFAKPGIGSGWSSNAGLKFLTSTKYFQSAVTAGGRNANPQPAQSPVR